MIYNHSMLFEFYLLMSIQAMIVEAYKIDKD